VWRSEVGAVGGTGGVERQSIELGKATTQYSLIIRGEPWIRKLKAMDRIANLTSISLGLFQPDLPHVPKVPISSSQLQTYDSADQLRKEAEEFEELPIEKDQIEIKLKNGVAITISLGLFQPDLPHVPKVPISSSQLQPFPSTTHNGAEEFEELPIEKDQIEIKLKNGVAITGGFDMPFSDCPKLVRLPTKIY
jgi:hypothetical protein